MSTIRPGRCYRNPKRAYTRISTRRPRKSYIKGVPGSKIVKFEVGKPKVNYPNVFTLVSKERVQIRHNALESARTNANKYLVNKMGKEDFFLKVLVYPHQVMRENSMATGAGADRLQEGMRRSFGKPIGFAAVVKEGQELMIVKVPSGKENIGKEALKRAAHKLPCPCQIV